jgi:hypothetical protein
MEKNQNWEDDELERYKSACFLTNYLSKKYSLTKTQKRTNSLVLGIRAEWGFGKTFFIKRWMEDLRDQNYPVVYFDAWQNDFADDPLIGFVDALDNDLKETYAHFGKARETLNEVVDLGKRLIKPVSLWALIQGVGATTGLDVKSLVEVLNSQADEMLDAHRQRRKLIDEFKNNLTKMVEFLDSQNGIQLPIFIFIDELDRCRPNYAIELLEAIKHLFGVNGIYFVVATNTEQLGHAVCAIYGEKFDSERYLKRFFEQEYILPPPKSEKFISVLLDRPTLNLAEKTYNIIDQRVYGLAPNVIELVVFAEAFALSLRDIEQVISMLEAVVLAWPDEEKIHYPFLIFLLVAKQVSADLFAKIYFKKLVSDSPVLSFRDQIKAFIKGNRNFKAYVLVDQHASRIETLDLLELCECYYQASKMNVREIYDISARQSFGLKHKIYNFIERDIPSSWGDVVPFHSLTKYSERVAQAGQLLSA